MDAFAIFDEAPFEFSHFLFRLLAVEEVFGGLLNDKQIGLEASLLKMETNLSGSFEF